MELVKWTDAGSSMKEPEQLRSDVEGTLQKFDLPYRVLSACSGDIGFPHAKQYDIEAFAAGQRRWLEVSSCSNFTDFQARRAGFATVKRRQAAASPYTEWIRFSGSRVSAAILENHLQADGRVRVPECLQTRCNRRILERQAREPAVIL